MESFTFKGVSSSSLGLIIKEMPPIVRAEKNIESISVNGRNGNLHIDNGTYKSIDISIICVVNDLTKIDLIKSTLIGTGEVTLSTVPGRSYTATIKNQLSLSKYLSCLREFPLQLELDPFSYGSLITNTYTVINNNREFDFSVGGNVETYPTLTINGIGSISLNGTQIQVTETGITIDCELMECVKNNANKNSSVILTEFPKLKPGVINSLETGIGITSVVISYREKWL